MIENLRAPHPHSSEGPEVPCLGRTFPWENRLFFHAVISLNDKVGDIGRLIRIDEPEGLSLKD